MIIYLCVNNIIMFSLLETNQEQYFKRKSSNNVNWCQMLSYSL